MPKTYLEWYLLVDTVVLLVSLLGAVLAWVAVAWVVVKYDLNSRT